MQPNKRKIFLHAIRSKLPEDTVLVQASCLIEALGLPVASSLAPQVDLLELIDTCRKQTEARIAALKAEVRRLEEASDLGLSDAIQELRGARKRLQAAATGRMQDPPLVQVVVGPFRAALTRSR